MREILFRGKRIVDNEWYYGSYLYPITIIDKEYGCPFYVVQETVSEYVGLKDKNGVKIFEGDILECENKVLAIVKYGVFNCGCCYGVYGYIFDPIDGKSNYDCDISDCSKFLVVGNIHDNSELIK